MLFVAFALLMAVSVPQARAALVVMEGGHAYEHNFQVSGARFNQLVVCDTKPDGWYIRGEAILNNGQVIKDTDDNGSAAPCDATLPYTSDIIAIRVCRVGDVCTSWRPS